MLDGNKRTHTLKKTSSLCLRVCLNMYVLLLPTSMKGLITKLSLQKQPLKCVIENIRKILKKYLEKNSFLVKLQTPYTGMFLKLNSFKVEVLYRNFRRDMTKSRIYRRIGRYPFSSSCNLILIFSCFEWNLGRSSTGV